MNYVSDITSNLEIGQSVANIDGPLGIHVDNGATCA